MFIDMDLWSFYTGAKTVTDESQLEMYNNWRASITPIIIGTNAFSTGKMIILTSDSPANSRWH
jgi:hypothetical protein